MLHRLHSYTNNNVIYNYLVPIHAQQNYSYENSVSEGEGK